jgi:hypothetical protein
MRVAPVVDADEGEGVTWQLTLNCLAGCAGGYQAGYQANDELRSVLGGARRRHERELGEDANACCKRRCWLRIS